MEKALNGTRPLNKRFEEPEVVAAINRLLDRIDTLENTVETLNRVVIEGPGFAAMATDIIDETIQKASSSGINVDNRLNNALSLAERVTDDRTVDTLSKALDLAQEAPGFVAMIVDMFDEHMQEAASEGVDVDARIKGFISLTKKITDPSTTGALENVLSPEAVKTVGALGNALADSQAEDIKPVGPMGLMKRMRDPDVKRAMGFLLNVAKSLGQELKK